MKRVLILSDNQQVISNFIEVQRQVGTPGYDFAFGCSDKERSLELSRKFGFEVKLVRLSEPKEIDRIIKKYCLVISLHCQQVFPKGLIDKVRCINVHPGYLPDNRGWYPHIFAMVFQLKAGVTIHEISDKIDAGAIIVRKETPYSWADTSLELYGRILEEEKEILRDNLNALLRGSYNTLIPEFTGKLVRKIDFEDLKEIDLNEVTTYGRVINRLRALTHGDYLNAFFVNPDNGKRIYIKITLKEVE